MKLGAMPYQIQDTITRTGGSISWIFPGLCSVLSIIPSQDVDSGIDFWKSPVRVAGDLGSSVKERTREQRT